MEVYNKFKKDLVLLCIVIMCLQMLYGWFDIGVDDTDGNRRSGVSLRVDAGTRCQYLEGTRGGLTPRLDSENNHICGR